jgi:homoserine O-acetyltransferase
MAVQKGTYGIGLECDLDKIIEALHAGINVLMVSKCLCHDLSNIPDKTFDTAVISHTIQELAHPDRAMQQLLRVAEWGLISFPNFGYIGMRLSLLFTGGMPRTKEFPYEWYDTPNIHNCTLADFYLLCKRFALKAKLLSCHSTSWLGKLLLLFGFTNLGADRVILRLTHDTAKDASNGK